MLNTRGNILASLPPVTKVILIINVVIFIIALLVERSGIRVDSFLALHNFKPAYFEASNMEGFKPTFFNPIQIVSHMFMHANLSHLFFNMFGLFLFGRVLESAMGSKKFFILYFVAGFGSALLQLGINYYQNNAIGIDILQHFENPTYTEFWRLINKLNFDSITSYEYRSNIVRFAQVWNENPDNIALAEQSKSFLHNVFGVYVNIPISFFYRSFNYASICHRMRHY